MLDVRTPATWRRLVGACRPAWSCGAFRFSRLGERRFSLARWIASERYWQFLGEFETPREARERAALIAEIETRN